MTPIQKQLLLSGGSRLVVSDSFNRADNALTLGNADTGQAWNPDIGTWGINSNLATQITSSEAVCSINSGISNLYLKVTFAIRAAAAVHRIRFRAASDAVNGDRITLLANDAGYSLYKTSAGASTSIASWAVPPQNGDIVEIYAKGSNIRIIINGVERFNVNESTSQFNTYVALSGNSIALRWNNLEVYAI